MRSMLFPTRTRSRCSASSRCCVGSAARATADLEQPNPLGGGTLPATFRIAAESVTAAVAVFTTNTTYDSAALRRLTEALAEQAGAPIPPGDLAALPPIEMADEGRYVFDRATGLMREVIVTRRITAGASRRVDGWEIRLIGGPQR